MKLNIGSLPHGPLNSLGDVPGVRVGHCTVDDGNCHTGVTVVLPPVHNPFTQKLIAASCVLNGFGKTLGLVQLNELGTLETPIALTNTLNVGKVHDALITYMLELCKEDGVPIYSVNPVVCECNDSRLNDIAVRPIGFEHVMQAIDSAGADFAQGAAGAGRGTVCYGMKGGIGSSSRMMTVDGRDYTMAVLVQSNYGASRDFLPLALKNNASACDKGSIIIVAATDLPLTQRQLGRVLRRSSVGMARLGSYIGHGSGEIAVGFTTVRPEPTGNGFCRVTALNEELLDLPFRAIGECVEEAILLSMLYAGSDLALDGTVIQSLADVMKMTP